MTTERQGFPNINAEFTRQDRVISQIWLQLLVTLWNRTGGTQGRAMVPTGSLMDFAGEIAPDGWLLCNGVAVARSAYADLFSVIGTTWGAGDSLTTFNLPDLRGRVNLGTSGSHALGSNGGAESVVLDIGQLASHDHGITDPGHIHAITDPGHNHLQNAHNHVQNSHNHIQDSHNHTQNAHNHLQDAHHHSEQVVNDPVDGVAGARGSSTASGTAAGNTGDTTATNQAATAVNQDTTATNQATTAVNQATTATNVSIVTGVTVNSHTTGVTTQDTGAGDPVPILPPYAAVLKIIKF